MVPVLFTFYIQGVLKLKNNSGAKGLKCFEIKIILVKKKSRKKTVYFSFYCNFKIVRFFCPTLYKHLFCRHRLIELYVLMRYREKERSPQLVPEWLCTHVNPCSAGATLLIKADFCTAARKPTHHTLQA